MDPIVSWIRVVPPNRIGRGLGESRTVVIAFRISLSHPVPLRRTVKLVNCPERPHDSSSVLNLYEMHLFPIILMAGWAVSADVPGKAFNRFITIWLENQVRAIMVSVLSKGLG